MFISLSLSLRAALLALFLAVLALPAAAQTTVVVTGSREALPAERLVGDVLVISAEALRASAADSVEDLLRREAGVQLSRSGGPGANAGLFIRGANTASTLVLIDGVRIGAATSGLPELEALSLASIDRIEVLRGPGSSLYGADAVGGVVQIFTRRGDGAPTASARLAAGGYGAREAALAGSGGFGRVDLAASLSGERNTGVSALRPNDLFGNYNPDRDGYSRRSAQLQAGFSPAAGQRVGLQLLDSLLKSQYDASEFLPPSFAQNNRPDFRNRTELRSATLRHDARWNEAWSTQLRASSQHSDLVAGANAPDHFRTERRELEAQASWRPGSAHSVTLALAHLEEKAQSSSYAADARRDNDALVVAYAGGLGPLQLQAEARHDHNSVYGNVDTGRLGAAWGLGQGWRLRALAASTFRAPSFNDLYFPGYGVTTIQPEHGRSVELGLQWSAGVNAAALTVYRNRVRGLIGYESDRRFCPPGFDYDFGCARNVGRARLQGATLSGSTRVGAWSLRGTVDFLDAIDADSGARLTRRAAHQETLALDYRQARWSAGAELVSVGARPESGKMLAAYTTLDLKARWQLSPGWQLEARLLNATNQDVEPARDYQSLGRQAWLGLRWDWQGL